MSAAGASALGLDIGLTGARAAVLSEGGELLAAARRPIRVALRSGRAEQDPWSWVSAAFAAGREAVVRAGRPAVAAIGVSALGPAPVLVDRHLAPLTPALLFALDTRAERQRARLAKLLGLGPDELTHDHALPKLLWWREHAPEKWERAALALDATGFVVGALTGLAVMDKVTAADYRLPGLSEPLALPPAASPLGVAGGLGRDAAVALGLPTGTPVAVGTYDSHADLAGLGVSRPGDAGIVLGSTVITCVVVDGPSGLGGVEASALPGAAPPVAVDGLSTSPSVEGATLLGGWTASSGSALAWFARELAGGVPEAELAAEAAVLPPGAGGLVALPYLAGERTPIHDPAARGLVLGLTLGTRRVEAYRAFVDAIALSTRAHAARLEDAGLAPARWRIGGGGTRNRAWLQATCDAVGTPLEVVRHAHEAIGPSRLALRAVGLDPAVPLERTLTPAPARTARFSDLSDVYESLHPALAGAMHRLGELNPEEDIDDTGHDAGRPAARYA